MNADAFKSIMVAPSASIKEAMGAIDHGGLRTAFVVDENRVLLGIVTDGDVRRAILKGIDTHDAVSSIMNTTPVTIPESTKRKEIEKVFFEHAILGIPVVNADGVLVDYVTRFTIQQNPLAHTTSTTSLGPSLHISRVLVIGGAGYIGSVLVRQLLAKGYSVTVLDSFLYGEESLAGVRDNPKLTIIRGDTRHIEDISAALHDVDAVVHLAELVGDPACALDPEVTQEINYLGTKTIAHMCKYHQVNRLVYISSCSVYGESHGDDLLTEESPLHPVSLYAKMKIASESALFELVDENFSPTILRLGTVFGFSPRPRFDLVVNVLTAKAIQESKITVFGGKQWRPNVHVGDVAKTVIAVIESPLATVGGQVFNVGSEENNYTIEDLGTMVSREVPSAELLIEDRSVDKRDYKVAFTKLKNAVKRPDWMSVADGIREIKDALANDPSITYTDVQHSNIAYLQQLQASAKKRGQ